MRWVLVLVWCAAVFGQPTSTAVGQTDDAQTDDARVEALALFHSAHDAYEAGDFQRSVVLLEQALALHDIPPLHYNLARALHELGRWEEARDEYVLFLRMEPDTGQRARVEARIVVLEETILSLETSPAETEPDVNLNVVTPPVEPGPPSAAPWIVFAAGGAALGAGAIFGALSRGSLQRARAAADHRSAVGPGETARTQSKVANALFIAGGITAGVGLVWGLVSRRRSRVEVEVGLGTLRVRGNF